MSGRLGIEGVGFPGGGGAGRPNTGRLGGNVCEDGLINVILELLTLFILDNSSVLICSF